MAKYAPLQQWLTRQSIRTEITMSFAEIEQLLDSPLPASAHRHRPWWGNNEASVQAAAWMSAGWLVDAVDQSARRVRFRRG